MLQVVTSSVSTIRWCGSTHGVFCAGDAPGSTGRLGVWEDTPPAGGDLFPLIGAL